MKKEVVIAGIPGKFWQIHEGERINGKFRLTDRIIEEFQTQKEAKIFAKENNLKIVGVESHK